ncbi:hypothetical protein HK104_010200, partial [Borealophlyctis nickersoniae]
TQDGNGALVYAQIPDDDLVLSVRASVQNRFGVFPNVPVSADVVRYEDTISGETWIMNVKVIPFGDYADGRLLLVTGVPREDIFGRVDAARNRSIGVAAGISAAVIVVVSVIFVLVVLPLARLAQAMETLTQLDFATLENGNLLEARSFIWELFQVQRTFSTMVKAFAGGIKKNRELANRTELTTSLLNTPSAAKTQQSGF